MIQLFIFLGLAMTSMQAMQKEIAIPTVPTSHPENKSAAESTHLRVELHSLTPAGKKQLADWKATLDAHKPVMNKAVYNLLLAQCEAHQKGTLPKIADPMVKSIAIVECGEALVDIKKQNDKRISMLQDPEKPFASPDFNSGFAAASKVRAKIFARLELMVEYLDALAKKFGYEPGQIEIKVFEGLRDLKTQAMLFHNKMAEIRTANKNMTEDELFAETCKWVSPVKDNIPVHSTGAAVDIRLWDTKNKQFLDMGPFGVIWGKNTVAPTYSEGLTPAQQNNRLYLQVAAAHAGLVNYPWEWWHFSSGDRYAQLWQPLDSHRSITAYGAVGE